MLAARQFALTKAMTPSKRMISLMKSGGIPIYAKAFTRTAYPKSSRGKNQKVPVSIVPAWTAAGYTVVAA